MSKCLPVIIGLAALIAACSAQAGEDAWTQPGGYVGVSGGFVPGTDTHGDNTLDTDELTYTHGLEVDSGWQVTVDGGAILSLGHMDWMRLRVGGEVGYTHFSIDPELDAFSGDTLTGKAGFWRLGPTAALDFRIPGSRWSFTAGLALGVAFVNVDANLIHGGTMDVSDDFVRLYVSGLMTANLELSKHTVLTMGVRSVWLNDATIAGTATMVGSNTYTVEHQIQAMAALEIGIRYSF